MKPKSEAVNLLEFFNLIVVGNLKTVIVMANITLLFQGTERSSTDTTSLETYANKFNEIFIEIEMDGTYHAHICLDKSTAVRLVRELKKQIGFLESEVNNG